MSKYTPLKNLFLLGFFCFGCSSDPKVNEFPSTANPEVEMRQVDEHLSQGKADQIDILSSKNFLAAKAARDAAAEARSKNKDQTVVLHQIALAQAYLDQGTRVAEFSGPLLKEPLEARADAIKARSQEYLSVEMQNADEHFQSLAAQLENKRSLKIPQSDLQSMESSYRDIELRSIKHAKLDSAISTLTMAEQEGAKKLTPKTLLWAQKILAQSEAVISTHRHDQTLVDQASMEATLASNRLLMMVRRTKGMSSNDYETTALQIEKNEARADRTLEDLESTDSQLARVKDQNQQLKSDIGQSRQFDSVRKQFTTEEADVYKVEDKLLLRLKGLSFKKNNSTIETTSYSLLSKVQQVISETSPSQIIIEGHTDSIGGQKLNQDLSLKRAQSVQEYLVSQNTVSSNQVSATGLGYTKPISTNKTAEGRAQNRRVDIILVPTTRF